MLELPKIAEIYGPVIQGEGPVIGAPTVFVRTGGCDFRCTWCDTDHAVLPEYRSQWQAMEPQAICDRVCELMPEPGLVTFSGGNPAIQPLEPVIVALRALGYQTLIETQGTVAPDWLSKLDAIVVSPKPPSSGQPFDLLQLQGFLATAGSVPSYCKIVIADETDFAWALSEVWGRTGALFEGPLYLQPMNAAHKPGAEPGLDALKDAYDRLCRMVAGIRIPKGVRVLPQLHVWAWGGGAGV